MNINIIKQFGTANTTYFAGRSIQYIVIHYTAGISSKKGSARSMVSWCANPTAKASADFSVDDEEIVQYNGDIENRYCWAVGGGKMNGKGGSFYGIAKNSNCISIEMCSVNSTGKITYPNDPHYSLTNSVVNNAVKLTKYLMKKYNIDEKHVIRHYDCNSKPCPGVIGWNADSGDESAWKNFKKRISGKNQGEQIYRVRISWEDITSQLGAYTELKNAKQNCPQGYAVFNDQGEQVYVPKQKSIYELTSTDLSGSESDKIATVAPIYQEIMEKTGMLASVGLAQFCLESGYATTDLALNANNMHGMKCSLSGNNWDNSVWDGKSKYTKKTAEQDKNGNQYFVTADFRSYPSIYNSVMDRAAYFIGAWSDAAKTIHRYPNINQIRNAEEQVKLIKAGSYATDVNYVSKLMNIIQRFNLTKYDNGITPKVWKQSKNIRYRIEVGSYKKYEKAQKIIDKILRKIGESSFIEMKDEKYLVICGIFENKENAEARNDLLTKNGFDSVINTINI